MIRSNHFHSVFMCCLNNRLHSLISCKCLYVYKVNKSCLCCILIQFNISLCLDCFLSTFFGCAECEKDRHLPKRHTKCLHCRLCLCKIKDIFIPVNTPLNNISLCRLDILSCCKNLFSCHTNDRYTDFRNSGADFNISYFYCIHDSFLS